MIKQVSSFLMACVIAQISFAQTSTNENLKLDLRKPTVVVVKGNPKDTSIAVKGETPLYIVDGKEIPDSMAKSEGKKVVNDTKVKAEKLLEDVEKMMSQIKSKP